MVNVVLLNTWWYASAQLHMKTKSCLNIHVQICRSTSADTSLFRTKFLFTFYFIIEVFAMILFVSIDQKKGGAIFTLNALITHYLN